MITVSPHIVVPNAGEASTWYARAFGAQEISRVPLPGDRVMSVEVRIGESAIHIGSEFPAAGILSPRSIGGTATVLQISTEDAKVLWSQALDAGAEERHPLAEQFWGELHGQLSDPFGHRWNVAQKIRDVPPDEIAAAAAEMFGQPATGSGSTDG
ncbi:MAG: VOC family protein [Solirubrobacterales bacterium]|nr:VOC family protein [Solirubrobacterales bacterium]